MRCAVSRLETENKWKGKFIHPKVLIAARFKTEAKGYSIRDALLYFQNKVNILLKEKKDLTQQEYVEELNKILEAKEHKK